MNGGSGSNALNMGVRQKLQRVRKRIVPSRKDMAIQGSRHQADVIKGDIALIDQAKSDLGLVAGPVK